MGRMKIGERLKIRDRRALGKGLGVKCKIVVGE